MSQSDKFIRLSAKSFLLSLGLTLVACGGGDSTTATDSYTGITTEATVDATNTESFTTAILDGSQDFQSIPLAVSETDLSKQNKQHALINMLVERVKSTIETDQANSSQVIGAIPETITDGACGGTQTLSISSATNSTLTYTDFCNYVDLAQTKKFTLSGSVSVSTTLNADFTLITAMDMTFNRLSMTLVDTTSGITYSSEFSGSISATFTYNADGTIKDINITTSVTFEENGKVYKLQDMNYTSSFDGLSSIYISGTMYHPDYGFVTFTTTTPFILVDNQLCGGTLYVTGANNSNVSITVDDTCTTYTYTGVDGNGIDFVL